MSTRCGSRGAIDREFDRWPLKGMTFDTELNKMHQWLQNRLTHISYLIAAIPEPGKTRQRQQLVVGSPM